MVSLTKHPVIEATGDRSTVVPALLEITIKLHLLKQVQRRNSCHINTIYEIRKLHLANSSITQDP